MNDKVRYEEINIEDKRHQQLILVLSRLNKFYSLELTLILSIKEKRDQLKGIMAFDGDKAIAYIIYEPICLMRYGMPSINFHLVDKNYRNHSLGSELLKQIEERFGGKVLGVEVDVRKLSKNYYKKMGYNFKYAICPLTNTKLKQIKYIDKHAPHIQIMFKLCETQERLDIANNAKEGIEKMLKLLQQDQRYSDALFHFVADFIHKEYDNKKSDAEFENLQEKTYTLLKNIANNTFTEEDKVLLTYIIMKERHTLKKYY